MLENRADIIKRCVESPCSSGKECADKGCSTGCSTSGKCYDDKQEWCTRGCQVKEGGEATEEEAGTEGESTEDA